jgi:sugar lactone lactonase YvrE
MFWILIADNRRLTQKSFILTSLFIVAISAIILFSRISINLYNNNNQAQAQQPQVESTKINKLWETPNDLKNPESVAYAPMQNVLFVSNVNGEPAQKDQNGFISKVSPSNGSIIELNWVTGLNAPKGIAISNNKSTLYVSDITDLVEINIDNGKIMKRFNAPGSAFLNDVTSDNQGNIYVSDTVTNTIYKLDTNAKDGNNNMSSLQAWLQSPQLNGPNGLHVDNSKNRLIVASLGDMSRPGGGIEVIDLKNKTITTLGKEGTTSPFGGLDGIESDTTEAHYYVTDNPAGKVYIVNADGTGYGTLIDLHTKGAADLSFIPNQSTIIIPLMQDNKLVAYKLAE